MRIKMKRFLGILLSLALMLGMMPGMALTAYAASHNITINNAPNGSVTASVNGSTVTSAAEGATVTLTGNPDNGYRLKTVSGTYQVVNPQETLSKGAATRTGDYFTLTASYSNDSGWNLYSSHTITISSTYGGNISGVVLNITPKTRFVFDEMSVNPGSMTRNGNVITISGINSSSVVITGTNRGGAYGCFVTSAQITGTGTVAKALTLSSAGDDNIKTFTMSSSDVTITAEFEEMPKATVTKAPTAKNLSYNGSAQELVTAGEASDGTMQYALGKDASTAPTDGWSADIPKGTDAKTYYVWYMAKGDDTHNDSDPGVVSVTIKENTSAHTHTIKLVGAKEPTCTEDGYEEHYECTECGAWFEDGSGHHQFSETEKAEITKKATGHKWDSGVVTKEATYDETGIKTYTCSVCGETKEETIPKKTRSYSNDSDNDSSDSGSSGSGSGGKSGSFSTQSLDVNGNDVAGSSGNIQPDSGMPVSDRGGNWGGIANNWSYTKSDGTLAKNEWLNLEYNGHTYWYFFDGNSTMQTDWLNYNGATYYFVPDMDGWCGRMATGWHQIGEKWYYFEPTAGAYQGVMYRGAVTPDGHIVGADGAWNGVGTTPESSAQTGTTASGT